MLTDLINLFFTSSQHDYACREVSFQTFCSFFVGVKNLIKYSKKLSCVKFPTPSGVMELDPIYEVNQGDTVQNIAIMMTGKTNCQAQP
jgi:hypothetical protein